jgi:hypothetical protein
MICEASWVIFLYDIWASLSPLAGCGRLTSGRWLTNSPISSLAGFRSSWTREAASPWRAQSSWRCLCISWRFSLFLPGHWRSFTAAAEALFGVVKQRPTVATASCPGLGYACPPRFWFPNRKNSRGGSGFPVTAVTEISRTVTGRIQISNFEFVFSWNGLISYFSCNLHLNKL